MIWHHNAIIGVSRQFLAGTHPALIAAKAPSVQRIIVHFALWL